MGQRPTPRHRRLLAIRFARLIDDISRGLGLAGDNTVVLRETPQIATRDVEDGDAWQTVGRVVAEESSQSHV